MPSWIGERCYIYFDLGGTDLTFYFSYIYMYIKTDISYLEISIYFKKTCLHVYKYFLSLSYICIYLLFPKKFLNISLALDSYLPKDFIDTVEWTLQLAQPVGTRFISSISPPLLARMYPSISHGCKRHRPDFLRVLAQSSIEERKRS